MANSYLWGDQGEVGGAGRVPAGVPGRDGDQGQGQDAHVLAAEQGGLRQGATHSPTTRVNLPMS